MSSKEGEEIANNSGHGLLNGDARRRSRRLAPGVIGVCLVMIVASSLALVLAPGARASPTPFYSSAVKVPCGGNIQNAINAAPPGGTILLAPCTYVQQLTIDKSVNIVGAGPGKTIIQSPTTLKPDAFGNPWTIELGSAATVALSGFTVLVTPQCIISSPYEAVNALPGYAGGGLGVGGSASLNLQSAVVTTTGQTEGGSCDSGAGFMSYGTGIGMGLDYVTGTPPANQLVGFGTVSGVTVSGFGFGGPDIAVGGAANSPAGSSALISNDRISVIGNTLPLETCPCAWGISVGFGGNASSATIVHNVVTGTPGTTFFPIQIGTGSYPGGTGSSAYIGGNWITGGGWADGVTVTLSSSATITGNSIAEFGTGPDYDGVFLASAGPATVTYNSIRMTSFDGIGIVDLSSSPATIEFNSITGPAVDGVGIQLDATSATVEYNSVSQMECEYNPTLGGPCGPDWLTQYAGYGIIDYSDAGLGTTIANNLIFSNDVGILLWSGCPGCVVKDNILVNNLDYGLAGLDGTYSSSQTSVVGGLYGVAAIAWTADTTVTLSQVVLVGQSVAPFYYEVDFTGGTATIVGT
jgi:parallel beta-helix repeat protein